MRSRHMAIGEKLGTAASAEFFESDPEIVTPTLDWYEDDEEHQTHMPEVDDITPEACDLDDPHHPHTDQKSV